MTDWTVRVAPVPASIDDPEAALLIGAVRVASAIDLATWGNDDLSYHPVEILIHHQHQEYDERTLLVALRDDAAADDADDAHADDEADVVGHASLTLPRVGNPHLAELIVGVHPDGQGAGVGSALLAEVERRASAAGRTVLLASSEHAGEPPANHPDALTPPTGSGRLLRTDRSVRFALRNGYALEQAERHSVLELPVDPLLLTREHDAAATRAGADYRVHTWMDRTPDEWLEQVARLHTRMSTDVPTAGLDLGEEPWDGARVRTEETKVAQSHRGVITVVVEHVPTGTLAGYTELEYSHDHPEVVYQQDTLVLREHRGRRLGILIKVEALRRLRVERPSARRIHTWNAEENSYMLAINVALGFRPVGVSAMWQKRLTG